MEGGNKRVNSKREKRRESGIKDEELKGQGVEIEDKKRRGEEQGDDNDDDESIGKARQRDQEPRGR